MIASACPGNKGLVPHTSSGGAEAQTSGATQGVHAQALTDTLRVSELDLAQMELPPSSPCDGPAREGSEGAADIADIAEGGGRMEKSFPWLRCLHCRPAVAFAMVPVTLATADLPTLVPPRSTIIWSL